MHLICGLNNKFEKDNVQTRNWEFRVLVALTLLVGTGLFFYPNPKKYINIVLQI